MQRWTVWVVGMTCGVFAACSGSGRHFGDDEGEAGANAEAGKGSSGAGAVAGAGSGSGGTVNGAGSAAGGDAGKGGQPPALGGQAGESPSGGQGGTSGTGNEPAAGAGGEPDNTVDPTPPTIVSITPADAAVGVAALTPIKITFSEPMDTTSVGAALSVSGFDAADLDVSWASGSKVVSILPPGGWKYATGTDPKLAALKLKVGVGTAAKDAQGDALAAPFSSTFSTRRRLTQVIPASSVGSYSTYGHAVGDGPLMCESATANVLIGKWSSQASGGTYYAFSVFDTSALGAASAQHDIEAVSLRATQTAPDGNFYAAHQVVAAKLAYQAIDEDVLSAAVTAQLGVFTNSAATLSPSLNGLASFQTDFNAGQKKHLYRFAPDLGNADSTYAHFSCGAFTLEVTHVLP